MSRDVMKKHKISRKKLSKFKSCTGLAAVGNQIVRSAAPSNVIHLAGNSTAQAARKVWRDGRPGRVHCTAHVVLLSKTAKGPAKASTGIHGNQVAVATSPVSLRPQKPFWRSARLVRFVFSSVSSCGSETRFWLVSRTFPGLATNQVVLWFRDISAAGSIAPTARLVPL